MSDSLVIDIKNGKVSQLYTNLHFCGAKSIDTIRQQSTGGTYMNTSQPISPSDFTTSVDTSNLTPEQEEKLLEMAQFFKEDLSK